jgi:hypothetical protein
LRFLGEDLPADLVSDRNLVAPDAKFSFSDRDLTPDEWRGLGFDGASVWSAPAFADRPEWDLRLCAGSPGTDPLVGALPVSPDCD